MGVVRSVIVFVAVACVAGVAAAQSIRGGRAESGIEPALAFDRFELEPVFAEGDAGAVKSKLMLSMAVTNKTNVNATRRAIGIEIRTAEGTLKEFAGFELQNDLGPGEFTMFRRIIAEASEVSPTDELVVRELAGLRHPSASASGAATAGSDINCEIHCNICQDRAEEMCIDGIERWECGCNPNFCRFRCVIPRK